MPHVEAPSGAPFAQEAPMIALEAATPPPATLAAVSPQVAALASGPYRIAFGCSLEPPSCGGEREGR